MEERWMSNCTISAFLADAARFQTIPIIRRFFADILNPLQIFENLKAEAVFLLESKDEESPWSRYSFIGLSPIMKIESIDGATFTVVNSQGQIVAKTNAFKDAFLFVKNELNVKPLQSEIPFTGGAVGYLSYDVISSIEKIHPHSHDDLMLKKASFLFCESMVVFDHAKRELIIVQYVRLSPRDEKQAMIRKYDEAMKKVDRLMRKVVQGFTQSVLPIFHEEQSAKVTFDHVASTYTKENFIRDVEKIKNYISSGDIFQAVLSQRFAIPIHVNGFQLYRMLRNVNPSPYMFYIHTDGFEIVGSSPEKLIEVHQRHIEIHPIAGTRRRGRNAEEDEQLAAELMSDPKEKAEHFMLVDLARNDIGKVAKYGTVKTPMLMELGKFSHVMHLISKVTGELRDDVHPIEALLAAFPAGTVSGAPKVRAMQIISELEPVARNLYAGAVAYISFDGNIDSCIAIRTAIVKDGYAYIQAGAGIVADSVPELEWKETQNKAGALMKAIILAEQVFHEKGGAYV
jgi:anthranilate synthase component I